MFFQPPKGSKLRKEIDVITDTSEIMGQDKGNGIDLMKV
jgi:hypothetical protein